MEKTVTRQDGKGRIRIDWKTLYKYIDEINTSGFVDEVQARANNDTQGCMSTIDSTMLYGLIRLFKPKVCLETGSRRGKSSAFILKALKDNNEGVLLGIERDTKIKIGELIPERLISPFRIYNMPVHKFADSEEFKNLKLDLFLHDSTHRYEHQLWEFKTFWDKINNGGLLCSHDILYNTSFIDFVNSKYIMDDKGLTDFIKSSFGVWGVLGNFGFLSKNEGNYEIPSI
jgi:hypothetical protein